jgi:predicted RNA-binding Zn-ribbon protein involved in translation (DUF1610 family)
MTDRVRPRVPGADTVPGGRARADGGTVSRRERGVDEKYCSNCGDAIAAAAAVCPSCGVRQQGQRSRPAPYGRLKAAGIGGFLGFVVLLIPLVNLFSPFVGGLVAGSLRGSDTTESALTGALANVFASVPLVVFGGLFFLLMTLGVVSDPAMGTGEAALGLAVWFGIFAVGFGLFYAVGAACGALGAALSGRAKPE